MASKTVSRALLLAMACACAGGKDAGVDITKPVTGAEASNAAKAYEKGMAEKKDGNPMEATRFFEYVRNNFPYSQYASLAQLAIADMAFERDDWNQAALQYQDFVKAHPSHPKADYAAFRVGQAYFNDRPSELFLLPPSFEKDQGPLRQALEALNRFVSAYPKSEYNAKARAMISDCREMLAAHERYVGEFYWKREQWKGAAGRFMTLADTYGDLEGGKLRSESLWRAAQAYRNASDPARERKTLQRLVQEAPQSPHRGEAEAMLQKIPAEAPPPGQKPESPQPAPEPAPKPNP
ncbi:MAG TPA: outer membrane protein assembly factor BamD [Myxococcales bacterium]|nr:outer membrane protein assembly factor BamD [Myxococcales bacterium]